MSVTATLSFLANDELYETERPYSLKFEAPEGLRRSNIQVEKHKQVIQNARQSEKSITVKDNGFALVKLDSKMAYEDFENEERVKAVYLVEVAEMLQKLVGASRVQVFEYVVRKEDVNYPISTGKPYKYNQPTTMVHIDLNKDWARKLAITLNHRIGLEKLPSENYRFYNIWKPLRGPVMNRPLALCDNSKLDLDTIMTADVVYQDFAVNNECMRYSEGQEWYFASNQTASEAWVFEQGDPKLDTRHGVPHCSFEHPKREVDEVPRETIEVRALAFFED